MENNNFFDKIINHNVNKKENLVAFGTGITYPFLFGNGIKAFVHTAYSYIKWLLKTEKKKTVGVFPTVRTTQKLIPCIYEAVNNGIRIFDCSRAYQGSEQRLGRVMNRVGRDKFFLITKIDDVAQFTGKVEECFEESLRQLNTDYVDLLLLHWPVDYPKTGDKRLDDSVPIYARSWRVLEQIYKRGGGKSNRSIQFQYITA